MKNELILDYEMALRGREYWLELKDKYQFETEDALIIFPSDNEQLNRSAIKLLHEFFEKKYIRKAVVVAVKDEFKDLLDICECSIGFEISRKQRISELLKYYRLIQFTKNIIVISFDEPYGNDYFIGKKGITIDDYVRNAIYV